MQRFSIFGGRKHTSAKEFEQCQSQRFSSCFCKAFTMELSKICEMVNHERFQLLLRKPGQSSQNARSNLVSNFESTGKVMTKMPLGHKTGRVEKNLHLTNITLKLREKLSKTSELRKTRIKVGIFLKQLNSSLTKSKS